MGKSCKVVVCGQGAVGKTAVLEQLLYANHVAGNFKLLFSMFELYKFVALLTCHAGTIHASVDCQ